MIDDVWRRALWQVVIISLGMLALVLLLGVLLDLWAGMR
jgi:hypothetical protein